MKLDDLPDAICAFCEKPFEAKRYDQRFCCPACKAAFESRERSARDKEARRKARSGYVCPECGEPFEATMVSQIYCSERCKTREMLRRFKARLGDDAYRARRREYKRRWRAKKRAGRGALCAVKAPRVPEGVGDGLENARRDG